MSSELKLCEFVPGKSLGWLVGARLLPAIGVTGLAALVTGGPGALLVGAAGSFGTGVYVKKFIFGVDEFSYAVVSRADKVLPMTFGNGLHEGIWGDEYHIIPQNPVTVDVKVERQLTDGSFATVVLQVTVIPHPRIANAQGLNAFGAWVVEGRRKGDLHFAEHEVQHAIVRPLASLISTILAGISQKDLDEMQNSLALLVESEVSLHTPIHRNAEHRRRVCRAGDDFTVEPEPADVLRWYHQRERQCREYLDRLSGEFNNDAAAEIDANTLSHHEIHVGSIFEHAEVIKVSYDEQTTDARKAQRIAQERAKGVKVVMDEVNAAAKAAKEAGGDPRVAQGLAGAQAGIPGVSVAVISGDPELGKAAAFGKAVGEGVKKGGGK